MLKRVLISLVVAGLLLSTTLRASGGNITHEKAIEVAKSLAEQERFDEALIWYKKAAKGGSLEALYLIGIAEIKGIGTNKNPIMGLLKIQSSADQGLSVAQFTLGYLYQKGKLGAVDFDKANYWYQVAAKQGFALAEVALGSLYAQGLGVEKNLNIAESWYRKAYSQGSTQGGFNLAIILLEQANGRKELNRALKIFHRLAESDHTKSQLMLSKLYLSGRAPELEPSQAKAIFWIQKAAGAGSVSAQLKLGSIYLKGGLLPANGQLAVYWLKKAALQGETKAQLGLVSAFLKGEVIPRDLPKAYMWLNVASELGDAKAVEFKAKLEQVLPEYQKNQALLAAKGVLTEIYAITQPKNPRRLDRPLDDHDVGLNI